MSSRAKRPCDPTEAELAERYYDRRHADGDWGEPEPLDKPVRLEVTLSVRFTREEVEAVRAAAERAGMKPTAFIRQAAVEALARRPVDRARLEKDLARAVELMRDAQRALAS
jgi:predicted component of type VI protein secretion system